MDKVEENKVPDKIVRGRFFTVIDNKDNRRFCVVNNKKAKLGKKDIDVSFFEGKRINSFWEIDNAEGGYKEITHQDFFNTNLCKTIINHS